MSYSSKVIKRIFDLFISVFLLIFLSPIYIFIGCLVFFLIGKPVLFRQKRPGLNGKPFVIYKFRTMTDKVDFERKLLPDEQRLGSFGRILRSTSLDELPALYNVIKGDISLVGPRPLLMRYLDRYTAEQARRHELKPGITGWAQVNGRNAISWDRKFEFDVWYVDNYTFWLDLKILFLTIVKVFMREGINQKGEATMEEFKGVTGSNKDKT